MCISQDSFYRELDTAEKAKADKGLFNFDHPSAFNETQVLQVLQDILAGKKVKIPVYDYKSNSQYVVYCFIDIDTDEINKANGDIHFI